MQNIELNNEELAVLKDVLRHTLEELDVEVFRTDTHSFKEMLKHRRGVIEHVLDRLQGVPVSA
jgi:hypothetical protein